MPPWSRATVADYRRLPLRAHAYLADVPVYDVWRVDLPGKDRPCTMTEVRATLHAAMREPGRAVRSLFALRWALGRWLRWDAPDRPSLEWSWRRKLEARDIVASAIPPGTPDGPFSVLYVHPKEAVSEIRNRTVHGFIVLAVEPTADGHALTLAIHVLPVSAWTRPYLALIKPFRRFIVYPSLLRRIHEAWS